LTNADRHIIIVPSIPLDGMQKTVKQFLE